MTVACLVLLTDFQTIIANTSKGNGCSIIMSAKGQVWRVDCFQIWVGPFTIWFHYLDKIMTSVASCWKCVNYFPRNKLWQLKSVIKRLLLSFKYNDFRWNNKKAMRIVGRMFMYLRKYVNRAMIYTSLYLVSHFTSQDRKSISCLCNIFNKYSKGCFSLI